jgi:hypothetical protein
MTSKCESGCTITDHIRLDTPECQSDGRFINYKNYNVSHTYDPLA